MYTGPAVSVSKKALTEPLYELINDHYFGRFSKMLFPGLSGADWQALLTIQNWMDMQIRVKHKGNILLAILSGGLMTCAFPKVGLDWMAWFAMVPMLAAIRGANAKEAFCIGLAAGLGHYLSLLYWLVGTMHGYGNLPIYLSVGLLILLAAYLALYIGVFAAAISMFCKRPRACWFLAPLLWVSLEYVRTFLLSGFPWALWGYSQYKQLLVIQISDFSGVYGISFLVAMVNGAVFLLLLVATRMKWQGEVQPVRGVRLPVFISLVCVVSTLGYGLWRTGCTDETVAKAPMARVAVVQGNVDQSIKWDRAYQQETIEKYITLSHAVSNSRPALVVWPETATPFYFSSAYNRSLTKRIQEAVGRIATWFLIGSPSYERSREHVKYFNSAYLLNPQGEKVAKYNKVHLVPYGEYIPLKRWFPFLGKIVAEVGDFNGGIKGSTLEWQKGLLGVQICFEVIFPELSRAMVANGAVLLVNMTNDAWFGKTSAPHQHFAMTVFRAVENRRFLVRAANTGISGFVAPTGKILATTDLYEDAVSSAEIALLEELTCYTRWGDWFAGLCLVTVLIFGIVGYKRGGMRLIHNEGREP